MRGENNQENTENAENSATTTTMADTSIRIAVAEWDFILSGQ